MQTPDPEYMAFRRDQEVVDDSGDGKYNSFDTADLYIPMKIFSLENFLEIADKIKSTSYGNGSLMTLFLTPCRQVKNQYVSVVQEDPIFQKSISEEELVANVFNTDHKVTISRKSIGKVASRPSSVRPRAHPSASGFSSSFSR